MQQKQPEDRKVIPRGLIDHLIERYKEYPQSVDFINAVVECFPNRDSQFIKGFINSTFINNKIDVCDYIQFKKLASHWNNVAFEKLNIGDYFNYSRTVSTMANFRIIAHFLENNRFNQNSN